MPVPVGAVRRAVSVYHIQGPLIFRVARVHLHRRLVIAPGLVHPAPLIAHGPLQEVPLPVVIRLGVEQLLRQVQVSLRDSQPDPLPRSAVSAAVAGVVAGVVAGIVPRAVAGIVAGAAAALAAGLGGLALIADGLVGLVDLLHPLLGQVL